MSKRQNPPDDKQSPRVTPAASRKKKQLAKNPPRPSPSLQLPATATATAPAWQEPHPYLQQPTPQLWHQEPNSVPLQQQSAPQGHHDARKSVRFPQQSPLGVQSQQQSIPMLQFMQPQLQQQFQQPQVQQQIQQLFGHSKQQSMPMLQFQQPQQQWGLFKADGSPAIGTTMIQDLHPKIHKFFQQTDNQMSGYRTASGQLEQHSRLEKLPARKDSLDAIARETITELEELSIGYMRLGVSMQELKNKSTVMLRETDESFHSYMLLKQKLAGSSSGCSSIPPPPPPTPPPPPDFYIGVPEQLPPFLQYGRADFKECLEERLRLNEVIEQRLLEDSLKTSISSADLLKFLPEIMSNIYNFLTQVAAKREELHQQLQRMKKSYLAELNGWGDLSNPFLYTDKWEAGKQEAASSKGADNRPASYQTLDHSRGFPPQSNASGAASLSPLGSNQTPLNGGIVLSASNPAIGSSLTSTVKPSASYQTLDHSRGFPPQSNASGAASLFPLGSNQTPLNGGIILSASNRAIGSSLTSTVKPSASYQTLHHFHGFPPQSNASGAASLSPLGSNQTPLNGGSVLSASNPAIGSSLTLTVESSGGAMDPKSTTTSPPASEHEDKGKRPVP